MAADTDKFHVWLCDRLKSLDLDEEVLGEYIAGVLDSDDSNEEEKVGILTDILEGMMVRFCSASSAMSRSLAKNYKEFKLKH